MRNRNILFMCIFTMAVLFLGITVSINTKKSYISLGIENVSDVNELQNLEIQINYAYGINHDEKSFCKDLETNTEAYIEDLDTASAILLIEPLGNFKQFRGSYSQDAVVSEIIRCENNTIEVGSTITIYQYGGIENHNGILNYVQTTNLLYPDNMYLVFLEESELNTYTGKNEFYYSNSIFSSIKLNDNAAETCTSFDFNECNDIHFFCVSEKISKSILLFEDALFQKYNIAYAPDTP